MEDGDSAADTSVQLSRLFCLDARQRDLHRRHIQNLVEAQERATLGSVAFNTSHSAGKSSLDVEMREWTREALVADGLALIDTRGLKPAHLDSRTGTYELSACGDVSVKWKEHEKPATPPRTLCMHIDAACTRVRVCLSDYACAQSASHLTCTAVSRGPLPRRIAQMYMSACAWIAKVHGSTRTSRWLDWQITTPREALHAVCTVYSAPRGRAAPYTLQVHHNMSGDATVCSVRIERAHQRILVMRSRSMLGVTSMTWLRWPPGTPVAEHLGEWECKCLMRALALRGRVDALAETARKPRRRGSPPISAEKMSQLAALERTWQERHARRKYHCMLQACPGAAKQPQKRERRHMPPPLLARISGPRDNLGQRPCRTATIGPPDLV